jgi:hypothetical protein
VINRRQVLAIGAVLPLACAPSSSNACSLHPAIGSSGAKALVEKLTQAWWKRDKAAFFEQFVSDLDDADRKQLSELFNKYFAEPAGERKLGNLLVRQDFTIFEVIESGTKRKSGICDGYPSSVIFKMRFSGAYGGFTSLAFVDEVLFVPKEWSHG